MIMSKISRYGSNDNNDWGGEEGSKEEYLIWQQYTIETKKDISRMLGS